MTACRRYLPWSILGLLLVLGLWPAHRSYLNFSISKSWFEARSTAHLTGMMLRIGQSTVYARNSNLLFSIESELPRKVFSPGPDSSVVDARLEIDGEWRGWADLSFNYDEGSLIIGLPEKFSFFPVEFNYARLRIAKTNLLDLRNIVGGVRQIAE